MFVTETADDVTACARRGRRAGARMPIIAFKRATATDVSAGRVSPSRHNTSSPDIVFSTFSDPAPAGKKCHVRERWKRLPGPNRIAVARPSNES